MVGRGRRNPRRHADGGNDGEQPDPCDIEIERLQQRILELELQQEERNSEEAGLELHFEGEEENPFGIPRRNAFETYQRHGQRQNHEDPLRSLGIRIEIPEFDGKAQPDDFIDCVNTVERVFDLKDVPDPIKVKLVALKLRKSASLWWEHEKKRRQRDGKTKVETWSKMKKLLQGKFLPVNHRQEAFLDYHNAGQRSSSVEDFIAEFDRLRMRCAVEEEEEQVIARFFGCS